jgi:hypothetical protein
VDKKKTLQARFLSLLCWRVFMTHAPADRKRPEKFAGLESQLRNMFASFEEIHQTLWRLAILSGFDDF